MVYYEASNFEFVLAYPPSNNFMKVVCINFSADQRKILEYPGAKTSHAWILWSEWVLNPKILNASLLDDVNGSWSKRIYLLITTMQSFANKLFASKIALLDWLVYTGATDPEYALRDDSLEYKGKVCLGYPMCCWNKSHKLDTEPLN